MVDNERDGAGLKWHYVRGTRTECKRPGARMHTVGANHEIEVFAAPIAAMHHYTVIGRI